MLTKRSGVGCAVLACGLLLLVLPVTVAAKPKEKAFKVPADKLFEAVLAVAAEEYEVTYSSEERKTVSFNTGSAVTHWGMHCTASVEAEGEKSVLKLNVRKTKGQLFAWGAGGRVAKKFFRQVQEMLKEMAQTRDE
jgi:hypothetical protein